MSQLKSRGKATGEATSLSQKGPLHEVKTEHPAGKVIPRSIYIANSDCKFRLSQNFAKGIHQAHHNEQQTCTFHPTLSSKRRRHTRRLLAATLNNRWTQTRQPALRIAQSVIEVRGMVGEHDRDQWCDRSRQIVVSSHVRCRIRRRCPRVQWL